MIDCLTHCYLAVCISQWAFSSSSLQWRNLANTMIFNIFHTGMAHLYIFDNPRKCTSSHLREIILPPAMQEPVDLPGSCSRVRISKKTPPPGPGPGQDHSPQDRVWPADSRMTAGGSSVIPWSLIIHHQQRVYVELAGPHMWRKFNLMCEHMPQAHKYNLILTVTNLIPYCPEKGPVKRNQSKMYLTWFIFQLIQSSIIIAPG